MALKSHSLLGFLLSLSVAWVFRGVSASLGGGNGGWLGGWTPITDISDPEVVEIGEFAINEHNNVAKTKLMFQRVIKGEKQVVAGLNYRLDIAAANDDAVSHVYEAAVWDQSWAHFRNLTSFKQLL